MEASDRKRFTELIVQLLEAFGREASQATFEAYWMGLSDLSLAAVQSGVTRAVRECEFMPPPARLRSLTGVVTQKDRGELAWETCFRAIGSVGGWDSPDFEDAAINATIRSLGGWISLTGQESERLTSFTRASFLKAYSAWVGRDGEATRHLPGMLEMQKDGRFKVRQIPCDYLPREERRFLPAPDDRKRLEEG